MTTSQPLGAPPSIARPSVPEQASEQLPPDRDAVWERALAQAQIIDPGQETIDSAVPRGAPMQGLTASGDTVMRRSAVAMAIGLVSPAVASASAQPVYGSQVLPPSVERSNAPPDIAATTMQSQVAGSIRQDLPQDVQQGLPPALPAPPIKSALLPAKALPTGPGTASSHVHLPSQLKGAGTQVEAASGKAAVPPRQSGSRLSALKSMIQVQCGHALTVASSISDIVPRPPPSRAGIVQLTAIDPTGPGMTEGGPLPADDMVAQAPGNGRTGIVQLAGLGSLGADSEAEASSSAALERPLPGPEAAHGPAPSEPAATAAQEPVRLYAEWSEQGVKIWLGADVDQLQNLPILAQQVQQWLTGQGERLLSLVCNGQDITAEAEAGLGLTDQSEAGRGDLPLPRLPSPSDNF